MLTVKSLNELNEFDAEYLRNGTRYGHNYNGILIATYTLFNGVIANDLE